MCSPAGSVMIIRRFSPKMKRCITALKKSYRKQSPTRPMYASPYFSRAFSTHPWQQFKRCRQQSPDAHQETQPSARREHGRCVQYLVATLIGKNLYTHMCSPPLTHLPRRILSVHTVDKYRHYHTQIFSRTNITHCSKFISSHMALTTR